MSVSITSQRGGSWLLEPPEPGSVMTPERLTDEHRLIRRTADEFVTKEVEPALARLEEKDWALARTLVRRCGELGLLGTDVPEAYGGVQLDKISSILVAECVARVASFGATFGGQTGLSILPIMCFGTPAQKDGYLPPLVSGELVGAYALSESGSGSDALAAKARAVRQPDGSFALNGEKMWITNGGFADLFIVFAKVDGEQFTAFIVERAFPGVTTGHEEHKLGLLGSSTTPLVLQEARVPADNVLGEIGKGHKVAFNTLNYGRLKLGAMCSGGGRQAVGEATRYAAERKQFGQSIAGFGAIKHKLAEMTTRLYAVESVLYRVGGAIDAALEGHDPEDGGAVLAALEEFAIESSIAKVAGSEMLDFVLDENIQIHGGNGFVKDYPAERHFRDARVNRIFEGTNEINRLLIPGLLVRRAVKGDLALVPAAKRLEDEILSPVPLEIEADESDALALEARYVGGFKKVCLMLIGLAMQRFGEALATEQEVLTYVADMLMDTFAAESALLRARQAGAARHPDAALQLDVTRIFVNDAAARLEAGARQALAAMAEGDVLRTELAAVRRLLRVVPINAVALRRRLADVMVGRGGYPFGD